MTIRWDFGNIIWYFFMIPFFTVGGIIMIGGYIYKIMGNDMDILFGVMGAVSLGVVVFLIWLDKNYDLDDNSCEEVKTHE